MWQVRRGDRGGESGGPGVGFGVAGRWAATYGVNKLDRLVAVKDRYGPGNAFHLNHNVTPSRAGAACPVAARRHGPIG